MIFHNPKILLDLKFVTIVLSAQEVWNKERGGGGGEKR